MARAFQQSLPADSDRSPGEWQALRSELVTLLNQVDSRVARSHDPELWREPRHRLDDPQMDSSLRHRDALKSVQRAITRFEEPMLQPQMPPNPRDTLQSAIDQIRGRQMAQPRPVPPRPNDGPMLERLAQSVGDLSGRLERLEGDIKAQVKTGANVKDVADQVAQLAHVVELLAGAVGETGQVKRLEGQIAGLGKIMEQGREMDVATLTRRLDDVASTVGKLAELQVHYADRVENPVDSQAFKDGMRSIEDSVRNVYDRIDTLERHASLTPADLEHLTGEMARFTEAMQAGAAQPHNLVELVDALNSRISDIESGDRLLLGLRKDLTSLRDAVVVSMAPRFDAIEQRIEAIGGAIGTREDLAALGRQIEDIGARVDARPSESGLGPLEAQVRQLVARMDQTGEQLSGLAKLYSSDAAAPMPDLSAIADLVASRTAEAMQHAAPDPSFADTIGRLETRITSMLQSMQHDPQIDGLDGMQAGINEVNERLKRLETSLLERNEAARPLAATAERSPDIASIIAATEREDAAWPSASVVAPPPVDYMPRSPAEDAPLNAPAFPEPDPLQAAVEALSLSRKYHPGLDDDQPIAARPPKPMSMLVPDVEAEPPPAPTPSPGFFEVQAGTHIAPADEPAPVPASSRNTFIEAHRRAAQRQPQAAPAMPAAASGSLIGRALSRFQIGAPGDKSKAEKPGVLAGDKPSQRTFKPEPVIAPTPAIEPPTATPPAVSTTIVKESFLLRHRQAILLGASVIAIAFLVGNLVVQRLNQPAVDAAPATTGDIDEPATAPNDAPASAAAEGTAMPRIIPMVDSLSTGSIDRSAARGFSSDPVQAMPSAFAPTSAASDASSPQSATAPPDAGAPIAPLDTPVSPVKVDLPADNVGPLDLRQAAADGDARAQFEVAAIYTEGRAVPRDYKAAGIWYERAAAQGFAPAQYRLGSLYENGNGVAKDLNTARLWYERAAEAGNRMSMHNLAALYAGGQLGTQQFDSAAKWFEEAASRGLTDSQFNLGMLYARGLGVKQSLEDSYKWFGIAALSGDKDAIKARDDIARSLAADRLSALSAQVAAFKPKSIDLGANFAPIGTWSKDFDPGETIATHDIVATVQKVLGKLGFDIGTPDGIAGKKTAYAIKGFEQATGMSPIGLINPRLLAVLGSQPV